MRAVVMQEIAGAVGVEEVEVPTLPDDAVLVEVRATGLCRSDWHAWPVMMTSSCRTCPVTSSPG